MLAGTAWGVLVLLQIRPPEGIAIDPAKPPIVVIDNLFIGNTRTQGGPFRCSLAQEAATDLDIILDSNRHLVPALAVGGGTP